MPAAVDRRCLRVIYCVTGKAGVATFLQDEANVLVQTLSVFNDHQSYMRGREEWHRERKKLLLCFSFSASTVALVTCCIIAYCGSIYSGLPRDKRVHSLYRMAGFGHFAELSEFVCLGSRRTCDRCLCCIHCLVSFHPTRYSRSTPCCASCCSRANRAMTASVSRHAGFVDSRVLID